MHKKNHTLQPGGLVRVCKIGSAMNISYWDHHINRLMKKNHMVVSVKRKACDKIQHPFTVKAQQTKNTGSFLNLTNSGYRKPTANVILGKNVEAFPLRSRTRQWFPLLLLVLALFFTLPEVLANALKQEKVIKDKKDGEGKEEIKLCLQMTWSSM